MRKIFLALLLLLPTSVWGQDCSNVTTLRQGTCPVGATGSECVIKDPAEELSYIELDNNFKNLINFCTPDTLAGNPTLASGHCTFATTGIICEGNIADDLEALFTVTNPTTDNTYTFPNTSGEVSLLGQLITSSEVSGSWTDAQVNGANEADEIPLGGGLSGSASNALVLSIRVLASPPGTPSGGDVYYDTSGAFCGYDGVALAWVVLGGGGTCS